MRKGIVVAIDPEGRTGRIEDENKQEISFIFNRVDEVPVIRTAVSFDISLGPDGLTAIDVKPIVSSGQAEISL
ncbi:hypothetical protein [Pedobacter aquatilis]|uniref:hypothetical protein n=1 Tax=Pedobacter aquatilis TaxID=351343 RepID=UPI00292DDF83|nr:hypothetical protein [Pedobacter aquatilis]